jgi:LmbE family N-acetylglucosaminyl deacetylase
MNHVLRRVLAVGAHPDDVEFMCAGLLALLKTANFEVHVATMSSGDCGSMDTEPEAPSHRQGEAEAACRLLGAITILSIFGISASFNDDAGNRRVTALRGKSILR